MYNPKLSQFIYPLAWNDSTNESGDFFREF